MKKCCCAAIYGNLQWYCVVAPKNMLHIEHYARATHTHTLGAFSFLQLPYGRQCVLMNCLTAFASLLCVLFANIILFCSFSISILKRQTITTMTRRPICTEVVMWRMFVCVCVFVVAFYNSVSLIGYFVGCPLHIATHTLIHRAVGLLARLFTCCPD